VLDQKFFFRTPAEISFYETENVNMKRKMTNVEKECGVDVFIYCIHLQNIFLMHTKSNILSMLKIIFTLKYF
jgi:hypothetical protein